MKTIFFASSAFFLTACSGVTHNQEVFSSHAESVNLLGLQIPGNTMERAKALVPANSEIKTINSTPNDTSSVLGVINRIIGFDMVNISGEINK